MVVIHIEKVCSRMSFNRSPRERVSRCVLRHHLSAYPRALGKVAQWPHFHKEGQHLAAVAGLTLTLFGCASDGNGDSSSFLALAGTRGAAPSQVPILVASTALLISQWFLSAFGQTILPGSLNARPSVGTAQVAISLFRPARI